MSTVFSLIFNPWLRIAALLLLSLGSVGYGIHKLKQQAVAEVEAKATAEALRRTENAIRSSDSLNLSPERLRDEDPNERK